MLTIQEAEYELEKGAEELWGSHRTTPQGDSAAELTCRKLYGSEGFLSGGLFAVHKFQIRQKTGSISAGL